MIGYAVFLRRAIVAMLMLGTFSALLSRYTASGVNGLHIAVRAGILGLVYLVSLVHFLRFGWRYPVVWRTFLGAIAILAMLSPPLVALGRGGDPKVVWTHFQNMALIFLPLSLVGMFCVRDMEWLPDLRKLLARLGDVVAAIGVAQWMIGYELLQAIGTNVEIGDGGFGANYGSAMDSEGNPLFRAFSTMLNHYDVGAFLVMSSLALLSLLASREITVKAWAARLGLTLFGILVTYNVTAWLLLLAANACAFALYLSCGRLKVRFRWIASFGVACLLALIPLSRSGFAHRLMANSNADLESGSSLASRFIFLYNGSRLIAQEPWGWGWNLDHQDVPYAITTDNYFMYITVFGGIWYTAVVLGFFALTLLVGVLSLRRLGRTAPRLLDTQVFLVSWVAVAAVCGLSNYFLAKGIGTVSLFWLCTGLVWTMSARAREVS